jgi:hypothetical protein
VTEGQEKAAYVLAGAGLAVTAVEAWFNVVPARILAESGGGPGVAAQQAMIAVGALTEEEVERFAEARKKAFANPLARAFLAQFVAVGRRPDS